MNASARRVGVALFLLVVGVGGCATVPKHRPVGEEAGRAIAALAERWRAFSDLRALADITLEQGRERRQLTGVLLARAPGSVRFEALSPFGQPLLLVAVHEDRIVAYDVAANEARVGPATPETTARVLGLPLEPEDLVAVLAGHAVPPRDLRVAEIVPRDEFGPSLKLVGPAYQQRVWMDFDTGLVHRVEFSGRRLDALIAFQRDADGTMAGFDVSAADAWVTGTVRYREFVAGAGVEAARFSLTLPKGAKIQGLR